MKFARFRRLLMERAPKIATALEVAEGTLVPMIPFDPGADVGRVLGDRYRVVAPIGAGASARVYVADDVVLRRRVAVKVLHEALAQDTAFLQRFQAEAQAAASLNHPNVLGVYDWGQDEVPFLVSEYLAGGSLRSLLDAVGVLSPSQGLLVALEVAKGLDYAHTQGLVHRDIKPANLLFGSDRRLRIADFGLARALAEAGWTEPTQSVVGTVRYAAPEQARGERLGPASDIYSLALVINEAVSGELPFAADTTIATLMARAENRLEPHPALGPIQGIVRRAGALDPDQRPTASQLVTELTIAANGMPRPDPLPLPPSSFNLDAPAGDQTQLLSQQHETIERDPSLVPGTGLAGSPSGAVADSDSSRSTATAPDNDDGPNRRWFALILALMVVAAAVVGGAVLWRDSQPVTHVVPNLVGVDLSEATAAVAEFGWVLERPDELRMDGTIAGEVLATDPEAGVDLEEGETLRIVVSLGEVLVEVPDLVNLTLVEAQALLEANRFELGQVEYVADEVVAQGIVLDVSLAPGVADQEPGTAIDLVVSEGPEDRSVPSIPVSRSPEETSDLLRSLRLVPVIATDRRHSESVPAGQVIALVPAPGGVLPVDSEVVIVISDGPAPRPVPDVLELTVTEATQILENAGFVVTVQGDAGFPVFETLPRSGEVEEFGARVVIITTGL